MLADLFGASGRIGRSSWWLGQVVCIAATLIAFTPFFTATRQNGAELSLSTASWMILILGAATAFVVNFCTTVKRFHDRGKSGWWFLITFVPFVGTPWVLVECGMLPGDDGANEYDFGSPSSAKHSRENLNREISGLASQSSSNFAKLDDDYIENYAKKFAMEKAMQQAAPEQFAAAGVSARPTFGKR
jgi:uncharacterized membrane protein YhaH (DUF805 family)